jgi:hypothetical protein
MAPITADGALESCTLLSARGKTALQQRLRLLQVGGVNALGEPAAARCDQCAGFLLLALVLPQPTETYGCPKLLQFGRWSAGDRKALREVDPCLLLI